MNLKTFLDTENIRPATFAESVGVTTQALYRYISGDRLPRRDVMDRIIAATAHRVQPNDFFERALADQQTSPAEAAA
jgi:predicted transcriptional regulator